jgi:hypothetical protein
MYKDTDDLRVLFIAAAKRCPTEYRTGETIHAAGRRANK